MFPIFQEKFWKDTKTHFLLCEGEYWNLMRVKKGIQTKRRATPALATLNCIMHSSILNILQGLKLKVSCLHRIFGIPLNLFHISFGNPKIFKQSIEFN